MECLRCFCCLLQNIFIFLKENSEWLCAIALAIFAYMQYRIILKQKNLALLDRRLELKNKFQDYVDERLKNYLEPELNIDAFKENYENMTKMAGDVFILFNKDLSERIMRLAERFEELKTSVHYNMRKNKKHDLGVYKLHDGEFEKDYGDIHAQINHQKNLLVADMQFIMRKNKV